MAFLYEELSPLFPLILTLGSIAVNEAINILKNGSIVLRYPELCIRKKIVIHYVILMAVADYKDRYWSFPVNGYECLFAARRINKGSHFIVNENRVRVRIAPPANEFYPAFLKIKHVTASLNSPATKVLPWLLESESGNIKETAAERMRGDIETRRLLRGGLRVIHTHGA
jgi:hypothetical protein